MMYDFKSLKELLRPHRIDIKNIHPLPIVMKDEQDIFSNYKLYKDSLFIGIGNKTKVLISREICLNKDHNEGLVTNHERIYHLDCYIYDYNKQSLEIITRWYIGYQKIQKIQKELVDFGIDDGIKFEKYLKNLKETKEL